MVYSSGSQPFQTRGPLDKFCLGSRTTQKVSTFSREDFLRLLKVIFPNFFRFADHKKEFRQFSKFPCIFQGQGQKKLANFHLQSSCDAIHEKVPSLSSQLHQKPS